ncbi:hypothetical protein ACSNOK_03130, partial [Streptomyces sp. URMC 126]
MGTRPDRPAPPRRDARTGQPGRPSDGGGDASSRAASDDTADEALRAALERAAAAERARDGAHQLSVLLLTTVSRLENDLSELRARDHARGARTEQLRRAHRRLQRSEARRALVVQELRRVRAELDALRRAAPPAPDIRTTPASPHTPSPDNHLT